MLRSQTDERLSALARDGNQQAFTAIYERYRRELGAHARRIVRADRADDVVQQAMLAAWNALLTGAEISDLRAWLHRVVHNAALDTVSRRGYDDRGIPDSSIAPALTEELAEGRVSAASALAALAALPESQRRALTLTAIEGRTGHDAASEMGITESAMRQLVYRARSGVRRAVTAITPVPLINWLVAAAGAPAPAATVTLGAAGGGAATVAKVIAVIGATAATVGATQALHAHHPRRHTLSAPTRQLATTIAGRGAFAGGLGAGQAAVNEQGTLGKRTAARKPAGEQTQIGGQNGGSQPGGAANNADHQSGSQGATGGVGDQRSGVGRQQSGPDQRSGMRQQQSGHDQRTITAPSNANDGSQPQQPNQANGGSSSGQPADQSKPRQNGQTGNGT